MSRRKLAKGKIVAYTRKEENIQALLSKGSKSAFLAHFGDC
jgi:hypothetical protein